MIIKKIHILYLFRGGVLIYAVHCIYIHTYIHIHTYRPSIISLASKLKNVQANGDSIAKVSVEGC